MADKQTLVYFGLPGRAEAIRTLLAATGHIDTDVVDERFPFTEWPERKPTTPYGAVPVLKVDGKATLAQSNAILRYFGRKYGGYPEDLFEAAHADAVLDSLEEFGSLLTPSIRTQNEEERKTLREAFVKESLPLYASRLQKHHESLGSPAFFVGKTISVADYKAAAIAGWFKSGKLDHIPTDVLDAYPVFAKSFEGVYSQEKVKAFKAQGR